jgi:hypothetical protein
MMQRLFARQSADDDALCSSEVTRTTGDPSPPSDSPASGAKPDEARESDTGILSKHGIVIARDIWRLRRALAEITGNATDDLNALVHVLTMEVQAELIELDRRIAFYDRRIRELHRISEMCQKLGEIEGIGPVTATALVAAVGDRSCFKNGRQFAAWLGLVPTQRSSGGRNRLFGISKRGDRYLRTLMIHGARAALGKAGGKQDPRSRRSLAFGSVGLRTSPLWRSPTRMLVSPGQCSPGMSLTNRRNPFRQLDAR